MSDVKHNPEFSEGPKPKFSEDAKYLAQAYARTFAGDDGKRVLADLLLKFGPHRQRFATNAGGRFDTIDAAKRDGQSDVLTEITDAIWRGGGAVDYPHPKRI